MLVTFQRAWQYVARLLPGKLTAAFGDQIGQLGEAIVELVGIVSRKHDAHVNTIFRTECRKPFAWLIAGMGMTDFAGAGGHTSLEGFAPRSRGQLAELYAELS